MYRIYHKSTMLFTCLVLIYTISHSQAKSTGLDSLDRSFFKWNRFSFRQQFDSIKYLCELSRIDYYKDNYMDYYCGELSDTSKSYLITNEKYHRFNKIDFDKVIFHLEGSNNSLLNSASICFIKNLPESLHSDSVYQAILKGMQSRYGNMTPTHLGKLDSNIVKTMKPNESYEYLSEKHPFSNVERTEWSGDRNIYMVLEYSKSEGLITLSVHEYLTALFLFSKNLYKESDYDEKYTQDFKNFDNNNGYKKLKFGSLKTATKNIVQISGPDVMNQYTVLDEAYKQWFYIFFDGCYLTFNKENKLYEVSLIKGDYSTSTYKEFLQEIVKLLGVPSKLKEKKGNSEFTSWTGKKVDLILMYTSDNTLVVNFSSPKLDDSSPSDKLY